MLRMPFLKTEDIHTVIRRPLMLRLNIGAEEEGRQHHAAHTRRQALEDFERKQHINAVRQMIAVPFQRAGRQIGNRAVADAPGQLMREQFLIQYLIGHKITSCLA
jgi:hypothetical protein